ncbi:TPA: glycosyltransferase [Klebsiella quasipneumoniae subsp. similipneumoniae]|uniref:glycosyltransferase n=1 Tax=Klebsiella quasipneumoniae TaxID=1463165 RepID=UPI0035A893C1
MLIVLTQMAIADYRNQFIRHLVDAMNDRDMQFKIVVGEGYFEESTKTSKFVLSLEETTVIRNSFFFKRRLAFQHLPWRTVLKADILICELNPRIISVWLVLFLRKILNKKTVFWGHVWARKGKESKTEKIRNLMRKASSSLLLYTNNQKQELLNAYGEKCKKDNEIFVAPNSLYYRKDMMNVLSSKSTGVIYVGRLVSSKKVDVLIKAIPLVCKVEPSIVFHIVGNGEQSNELKKMSGDLGIDENIIFYGHIADHSKLKEIYSKSFVSISPGYVGLSITQSLSFGVPMLISKDENHSPELEALQPGLNGGFFNTNDPQSLADEILKYFHGREYNMFDGEKIVNDCKHRYSVETMVDGVIESVTQTR